jgi:thiol-disulfide isomerase/thioredoxin
MGATHARAYTRLLAPALALVVGCQQVGSPEASPVSPPGAGVTWFAAEEAPVAPDFEYRSLDGAPPFRLSGLRGRVVAIDYWATWCPDCLREIPDQVELRKRFGPRGVEFLDVCHRRGGVERIQKVIAERGAPARQMIDEGERPERISTILDASRLPAMFLVDRQGRMRLRYLGGQGARMETIARRLEELLAEEG